jgi:hypothetical protein
MKKLIGLFLLLVTFLSACAIDTAPAPDSDSNQNYTTDSRIPVDDNVYLLKGEVSSDVDSLTQQLGEGSTSGFAYGGYGSVSGSWAVWQEGKGFVRLKVKSIDPPTKRANPGDLIVVKTTDQKIRALLPGDIVTFKCRVQYEAIAAVRNNETFDAEKLGTWELDYCRMLEPKVGE